MSPVNQSIHTGYKFFSESYIHEIEGKCSSFPVNQLKDSWFHRNSKLTLLLNVMFSAAVAIFEDSISADFGCFPRRFDK